MFGTYESIQFHIEYRCASSGQKTERHLWGSKISFGHMSLISAQHEQIWHFWKKVDFQVTVRLLIIYKSKLKIPNFDIQIVYAFGYIFHWYVLIHLIYFYVEVSDDVSVDPDSFEDSSSLSDSSDLSSLKRNVTRFFSGNPITHKRCNLRFLVDNF